MTVRERSELLREEFRLKRVAEALRCRGPNLERLG